MRSRALNQEAALTVLSTEQLSEREEVIIHPRERASHSVLAEGGRDSRAALGKYRSNR